ncbi:MAG: serine protease [Frankiales bacterium]|jgi:hypothetical protein|nr:serine protease [Frankiales bacterium]
MFRRVLASVFVLSSLVIVGPTVLPSATAATAPSAAGGDAVVIAVIDTAFTTYHYDFLGSQMPQHKNASTADDLPLDQPASQWLAGFDTKGMASYQPLNVTLPTSPDDNPATLQAKDAATWASVKDSTSSRAPNVYWLPGTKVIAAATFGGSIYGASTEHGTGTSSVSVGNLHGTCPECLVVLLSGDHEKALNWAMRQPWIDAITNSYGISTAVAVRDRVYNGCALDLQKAAVTRGQGIYFSAGNGVENAFVVPNSTLFSCQEGPDWLVTVGAINSSDIVYVGPDEISVNSKKPGGAPDSGKPADVSSIGDSYPSAYEATTVGGSGATGFGGTSNATPVITGMYARALWEARTAMAGVSRVQSGGVVSVGAATCGTKRPHCEVADGKLTYVELRNRLYDAALPTKGTSPGGLVTTVDTEDTRYLAEGHGALTGRLFGDATWAAEHERIVGTVLGRRFAPGNDPDEATYAAAVSYCSQHLWGSWNGGAWRTGQPVPGDAPVVWPTRTTLTRVCPQLKAPPRQPYVALYGDPEA